MTSMYSNIISKYRDKYTRDDNDNNYDTYNNNYDTYNNNYDTYNNNSNFNYNFNTYKPIIPSYRIIRRRRYRHILFKDEDISVSILGKKRKYDDAFI